MRQYISSIVLSFTLALGLSSCDKNNNVVLFSVEDDKALGAQVAAEVDSTFPILPEAQYPEAYDYVRDIVDEILAGGEVAYDEDFVWQTKIIADDSTLNAFATPGGYMYVYTGLIKYLGDADALAGVMGHEMAHADLRHTSRNLQKQYGISVLLSMLLGDNPGQLEQIAAQIAGTAAGLKFSREFEQEADAKSVEYLATTQYACDGAKIFFEKIEASGQGGGTPEFLSTHPSPDSRIEDIEAKADEENCDTTPTTNTGYSAMVATLP